MISFYHYFLFLFCRKSAQVAIISPDFDFKTMGIGGLDKVLSVHVSLVNQLVNSLSFCRNFPTFSEEPLHLVSSLRNRWRQWVSKPHPLLIDICKYMYLYSYISFV